jgi:hypothetical protein
VGETGGRNDSLPAYAWAVGYTRVFTPTLTNDMHVGMVHSDKLQRSFFGNQFGIPAQYGIQGVPQVADNGGLPPIAISGLTHLGVGNYIPTLQYVWSLEGVDAVTKVVRNHTLKAGIQVDDLEADISQPPQGRGDFYFNGMYTDIPNRIAPTTCSPLSGTCTGLNGIGDLLVAPIPSLVTPNGIARRSFRRWRRPFAPARFQLYPCPNHAPLLQPERRGRPGTAPFPRRDRPKPPLRESVCLSDSHRTKRRPWSKLPRMK